MKKIISLLLAVLMLPAVAVPAAAADGESDVPPLTAVVEEGVMTSTITITASKEVNNGTVTISYPLETTLVSVSSDIAVDSGVNNVFEDRETGEVTVSWATLQGGTSSKKVLSVVLSGPVGNYTAYVSAATLANGTDRLSADRVAVPFTLSGKPQSNSPVFPVIPSPGPDEDDPGDTGVLEKFKDINNAAWYSEAVTYVVQKGLMRGVSEDMFDPEGKLTRAMIVCVLYRAVDSPAAADTNAFPDVAPGSWYADAVSWARSQGIVLGYEDGSYRPDSPLIRQDLVTILYRFAAKYLGAGETGGGLGAFADADSVSGYAVDAMRWAVNSGVINGFTSDGVAILRPDYVATRAQFAMVIYNLYESVSKN